MTHLANADDKHDDMTLKQITLFNDTLASFKLEPIVNVASLIQQAFWHGNRR